MGLDAVGLSGGLFICWQNGIVLEVGNSNKFVIELYVRSFPSFQHWVLYCVYGAPDAMFYANFTGFLGVSTFITMDDDG